MAESIIVKSVSPVQDKNSFLHSWDSSARKSFSAFEQYKVGLKSGLSAIYSNPLTNWKDEVQLGHRYQELNTLNLRQQLGDIQPSEVQEVN